MKSQIKTMYKPTAKYELHQEVYDNKTKQPGIVTGIAHVNRKGEQCYCVRWQDDSQGFYPESIISKMSDAYEEYFAENHKFLKHIRKRLGAKKYNSMITDVFQGNKSTKELLKETSETVKNSTKNKKKA